MPEVVHEPLVPNSSCAIEVEGRSALLCNFGGTHSAIQNECTHQESPLIDGRVRNGFVSCPLHGVKFNLATGEPQGKLTRVPLETFEARDEDGMVVIFI